MDNDEFVKHFCIDCIAVLSHYDNLIRSKIINGPNAEFYESDRKGLGIYSTTEPIIKYLIFTNLLDKYCMWSEDSDYYANGQLLDLGLYNGDDYEVEPNIAIEMKWTNITKDGHFKQNKLNHFTDDIIKLYQCARKTDKYIMQFMILDKDFFSGFKTLDNAIEEMTTQINSSVKQYAIKGSGIQFIHKSCFPTFGRSDKDKLDFFLLLWKMI